MKRYGVKPVLSYDDLLKRAKEALDEALEQ